MSKFEDHLWREFMREHGDALTQVRRPTATHTRVARPRVLVGTGLGLAGVGGVVALVLGAATTSPAFAVTRNGDGTVSISIARPSGVAGANAELHQLGIRARVTLDVPVGCRGTWTVSHQGQGAAVPSHEMREIANAHWRIDPRRIPAGSTLALTPPPAPSGQDSGNSGNSGSGGTSGSSGMTFSCGTEGPGNGHSAPPPSPQSGNSGNSGASGNS